MTGGTAAARTGAIGAELLEMIARVNDSRLKRSSGTAQKAKVLRKKFTALAATDTKVFANIKKVYKIRGEKPLLWQRALKEGAQPPLGICELCASGARLLKKEAPRTSAWLASDLLETKIILRAAFLGGRLNAEANFKEISDALFVRRMRGKIAQWQSKL